MRHTKITVEQKEEIRTLYAIGACRGRRPHFFTRHVPSDSSCGFRTRFEVARNQKNSVTVHGRLHRERTGSDRCGAETAKVSGNGGSLVPANSDPTQRLACMASLRKLAPWHLLPRTGSLARLTSG
jgi:hypothetical protein